VRNEASAAVTYRFNEQGTKISPREIVTHTACLPGTIAFDAKGAAAQYETRGGQVFTLKASPAGVVVDVSGAK
jgi:hypothetical protein